MGLDITVGMLADLIEHDSEGADWFREEVEEVNALLRRHGLPEHHEPAQVDTIVAYDMYGYSGLHYLRRFAAYLAEGLEPQPLREEEDPSEDPVSVRYYDRVGGDGLLARLRGRGKRTDPLPFEHLMVHADNEGFYVPIEFERPLVEGDTMLGSSHRLRDECERLAAALELPAELDPESDELTLAAEEPDPNGPPWRRFAIEALTCQQLLWAARASVDQRALLVFH